MLKQSVNDPQGNAVLNGLNSLGFKLLMYQYAKIDFCHLVDPYSANFFDRGNYVMLLALS